MSFILVNRSFDELENLSNTRWCLLAIIAQHADNDGKNSFPSTKLLCKKLGIGERQLQRHIKALRDMGLIRYKDTKFGRGQHRMFEVLIPINILDYKRKQPNLKIVKSYLHQFAATGTDDAVPASDYLNDDLMTDTDGEQYPF